ncbi:hypothetical protein U1Q18_052659 [Sarracenia purpurea var. burkii]
MYGILNLGGMGASMMAGVNFGVCPGFPQAPIPPRCSRGATCCSLQACPSASGWATGRSGLWFRCWTTTLSRGGARLPTSSSLSGRGTSRLTLAGGGPSGTTRELATSSRWLGVV